MLALFILSAIASPAAADIHALEVTRVMIPDVSHARDGRAYVEFAPTIETRNVHCVLVDAAVFDCDYELRTKNFFTADFSSWAPKHERVIWRDKRWQILSKK